MTVKNKKIFKKEEASGLLSSFRIKTPLIKLHLVGRLLFQ